MSKFKHGYYHALKTLFPEVKFAPKIMQCMCLISTLSVMIPIIYIFADFKIENRRSFFETYAKTMGFDPLNPSKWYLQPLDNILATKVIESLLAVLPSLFPINIIFLFFIFH